MENIYNKSVLSLRLINHIINNNEVIRTYGNVSKISFSQLLSIIIIRELNKLEMGPGLIDDSVIINYDFTRIIEETIVSKTSRVIVSLGGGIKSFSRSYAQRLYRPLPLAKNSIPFSEIITNIIEELASRLYSTHENRNQFLTDEELRKYYPLEEFNEEEFKICVESIRELTILFFDILDKTSNSTNKS
ncbi:MAG: hypothetical protein P9L97_06540 [Candidatus Tenebribacter davisii]|jgi:hypothetical protein|nr:hypothetical protein [Candidatus Tenebribacter davisii]